MRFIAADLLLGSLRTDHPPGRVDRIPQALAYEVLREIAGRDYGYNIDLWERWWAMNATAVDNDRYQVALDAVHTAVLPYWVPLHDLHYQPPGTYLRLRERALLFLRAITGLDLGTDYARWRTYIARNHRIVAEDKLEALHRFRTAQAAHTPYQLLLENLAPGDDSVLTLLDTRLFFGDPGRIPMKDAAAALTTLTGEDFGMAGDRWEGWLRDRLAMFDDDEVRDAWREVVQPLIS